MLIISITNWMKVKLWSTLIYCFDFVEGYDVTDFLVSIVVSIPACHAGDRGSIPRRGVKCIYSQSQTHSTWCYLRSMWCLWARRGSLLPSPIERNWSNDPALVRGMEFFGMAERSKELCSGRTLLRRRGFEPHFWQDVWGYPTKNKTTIMMTFLFQRIRKVRLARCS